MRGDILSTWIDIVLACEGSLTPAQISLKGFEQGLVPSSVQSIHSGKVSAYLGAFHHCNSQPTSPLLGQCTLTERHFNNDMGIYSPYC